MRVTVFSEPLDFLPTFAQRRRRDYRRFARVWAVAGLVGLSLVAVPGGCDEQARRRDLAQIESLRAAQMKLRGEQMAYIETMRALNPERAHRQAVVAISRMRWSASGRLLDVIRLAGDGLRLTTLEAREKALRIEGFALTQTRVRDLQKRLRALDWVSKVSEVESSAVPEALARALVDATDESGAQGAGAAGNAAAGHSLEAAGKVGVSPRRTAAGAGKTKAVPDLRRFALRVESKSGLALALAAAHAANGEAEGGVGADGRGKLRRPMSSVSRQRTTIASIDALFDGEAEILRPRVHAVRRVLSAKNSHNGVSDAR